MLNNRYRIIIKQVIKLNLFFLLAYNIMSLQKQKLAQMVLQKMKEKKEAQQRNRPHYQLLQLNVKFSLEQNQSLKQQVDSLTKQLTQQKSMLNQLSQNLQELQNTGKKTYPTIIIKPDFIASENVAISFKEFYRKTSNTFLKTDIIKMQKYGAYLEKQKIIISKNDEIFTKQIDQENLTVKNIKIMQQKRYKVLKQDVKRRLLIEEQSKINHALQQLKESNQSLLRQYQVKKENLQNRMQYSEDLKVNIQQQKRKIENKFNPITYRQYLKQIFNVRIKNQLMEKNLLEILKSFNETKKLSQKYKQDFHTKFSITFIGKSSDSPSKIRGKIQNNLQSQSSKRSQINPKNLTQMINLKSSTTQTSVSKLKKSRSYIDSQSDVRSHLNFTKRKGLNTSRQYSSVTTLRNTMKSTIKSERTLSTTLAMSTAKKRFSDLERQ